jgi:hypothetical protein
MRLPLALLAVTVIGTAACTRVENSSNFNNSTDSGLAFIPQDGGSEVIGDPITVKSAVSQAGTLHAVAVKDAVVVAATSYASGSSTIGTFYVQDADGGPGIAVYHGKYDTTLFPAVGDVVTVSGHFSTFDGSLQISSSTKYMTTLSVTKTGTGTSTGGAYAPAGTPILLTSTDGYSHATTGAHADQRGNVLQFAGPLTVTDPSAFVNTDSDGGTKTEGFEVTGGLWVDDTNVWYDCIRPLDGGTLDLTNGIRGVWDGYEDFNGGTSSHPAATVPVLVPLTCADLSP